MISKSKDADVVKQAAAGRWSEVLESVAGIPRDLLDGRHHPCPRCGGSDRFRLVDEEAGAVLCNQCFRERNGDGIAAVGWMRQVGFSDALALVAGHLGVELKPAKSSGKERPAPDGKLHFLPWNPTLIGLWCQARGIKPDAIQSVGGQCARYYDQYTVLALPVLGPQLHDAAPIGWIVERLDGGDLPVFDGRDIVGTTRRKVTHGSRPGLVCSRTIRAASVIWKTEGPTDLLALLSCDDFPPTHGACTNSHGCGESPAKVPALREVFRATVTAYVCHDADAPGQEGATWRVSTSGSRTPGWAPTIAGLVTDCRNVVLPYDLQPAKGKDLRDYLSEGRSYGDLLRLAASMPTIEGVGIVNEAPESWDNGYFLAGYNLRRYCEHVQCPESQRPLRFWRGSWWKWQGQKYVSISNTDLRAKVQRSIRQAFIDEYHARQDEKDPPTIVRDVQQPHVHRAIAAMEDVCLVSEAVELNTWIAGDLRERRGYCGLENGILDMDRLLAGEMSGDEELMPHSPDWFSMFCLPYRFDPAAQCPQWLDFLDYVMDGDQERIALLQEWCGYCLRPDTSQQKFLLIYGDGANGKSVFTEGLRAILGRENCSSVPLESFGDRFSKTMTLGKLLNISSDAGHLDGNSEGLIKAYTAGDPVMFDRKGLPPIECVPTARLVISCNNLPRWQDKTDGPWRRMIVVPFSRTVEAARRKLGMDRCEWWRDNGELPGMLLWSIAGLSRLQRQGWTHSTVCHEALEGYRESNNPALVFLREAYRRVPGDSFIAKDVVYKAYRDWCTTNGYHALASNAFGREVVRVLNPKVTKRTIDGKRGWVYSGIEEIQDHDF